MKRSARNILFPTAVLFATAAASVAFSDDAGTADVTETLVHAQYDDTWRRSKDGYPYEDSYSYTIEINKPFATDPVLDHARQQDSLSHQDSVVMLNTTGLYYSETAVFHFTENGDSIVVQSPSDQGISEQKYRVAKRTQNETFMRVWASR